jgi:hypothetical protein
VKCQKAVALATNSLLRALNWPPNTRKPITMKNSMAAITTSRCRPVIAHT